MARKQIQMVFQGPAIIPEPAQARRTDRRRRATPTAAFPETKSKPPSRTCSARSAFNPEHINRFPHEFSGGQRQRIGLARDSRSATQSARTRRTRLGPRRVCSRPSDQPLGRSQGRISPRLHLRRARSGGSQTRLRSCRSDVSRENGCELSPAEELYSKPIHPYTSALLEAIPIPVFEDQETVEANRSRRTAQPDRPPVRVPLPHEMSTRN